MGWGAPAVPVVALLSSATPICGTDVLVARTRATSELVAAAVHSWSAAVIPIGGAWGTTKIYTLWSDQCAYLSLLPWDCSFWCSMAHALDMLTVLAAA